MVCTAQHSAPAPDDGPSTPRRARGEKERERHGQTVTAYPAPQRMDGDDQRPAPLAPAPPARRTPAARMICTTCPPSAPAPRPQTAPARRGEEGEEREGERSKAKKPSPTPSKSYIPNRHPTSTSPAHWRPSRSPVLSPACRLCPSSCNSAFGEFAEPRPAEAPIADGKRIPDACPTYRHRGSLYISNAPVNSTN